MLLIRLLRLIPGYVLFTASGGFPERFVNLCAGLRIAVWDVRPRGGVLYGKVGVRDYRRLRTAAKRAGMRLRICGKKGLPFLLHRRRDRFGLPIAAAVFLLLLFVLSGRVWRIDVDSDDPWTRETVRQTLSELGVREGMRASDVDASRTERALLLELPDVEWIALNLNGSALHVTLRDAVSVSPPEDYTHPCHIVAAKDGFLRRLEVYEGTKQAALRTAVQKGQLLISGAVEHTNSPVTFHHAKGYAEAETTQTVCVTLPQRCAFPTVDRARFRVRLQFFSLRIPLGDPRPAENAAYFVFTRSGTASGIRLPFACTTFRNLFFTEPKPLSAGQRQLLLLSDFGQRAAAELRAGRILQANVACGKDKCTGTFRTLENIGVEQPIVTEQTAS